MSQQRHAIAHPSDIAVVRRAGMQLAGEIKLDETATGKLAILITEAVTNILKHAQSGEVLLDVSGSDGLPGIDVLALDKGPGIPNLNQSLRDGVSTAGTPGNGLGAINRMADYFDVHTAPGKGTALYIRVSNKSAPKKELPYEVGAVCLPMPGEEAYGDGWSVAQNQNPWTLLVSDGLGHGPEAERASQGAMQALEAYAGLPPQRLIEAIHASIRATRGAAVAVAKLSIDAASLTYAGVGNISACVSSGEQCKQLMSHNGIVGHNMRKVQEFNMPFPKDGIFILHSDGLSTQWNLTAYPGLQSCHSSLIAGVLYRDFSRGRDDVTVVVIKPKAQSFV